eukprot:CAMPEP_0197652378 /NCGR_PEP_ID=MMETSP1338-20131121/34416_1 /TAXON_ID=43686 ORGANISM="Pelagodinium beii, Strain RCC1491" /NCGR_SAMPLE_ID=MMETSP1338 /ASSEMBLY_ACC=CAM_ASM_000754 /LENGTH=143 /DNA_ID=CAMNT_0043227245 /DNA_START=185 /DNA_END=615 /DNA_ORIENTATION=+
MASSTESAAPSASVAACGSQGALSKLREREALQKDANRRAAAGWDSEDDSMEPQVGDKSGLPSIGLHSFLRQISSGTDTSNGRSTSKKTVKPRASTVSAPAELVRRKPSMTQAGSQAYMQRTPRSLSQLSRVVAEARRAAPVR